MIDLIGADIYPVLFCNRVGELAAKQDVGRLATLHGCLHTHPIAQSLDRKPGILVTIGNEVFAGAYGM